MVSFVPFFNFLITLTEEIEMSLNYSPAVTSFSHKELLKLPQGLSVGRICVSFVGEIAENQRNLRLDSWCSVLLVMELWISVQMYSCVNKRRAGQHTVVSRDPYCLSMTDPSEHIRGNSKWPYL